MPVCAFPGCTNRRRNLTLKGITYHRFPKKDLDRRQRWIDFVGRVGWTPHIRSILCSAHFSEGCMDRTGQTTRLREGAVPTIRHVTISQSQKALKRHKRKRRLPVKLKIPLRPLKENITSVTPSTSKGASKSSASPTPEPVSMDHSYANMDSPRDLKQKLDEMSTSLHRCVEDLRAEQERTRILETILASYSAGESPASLKKKLEKVNGDLRSCSMQLVDEQVKSKLLEDKLASTVKTSKDLQERFDAVIETMRKFSEGMKTEQDKSTKLEKKIAKLKAVLEFLRDEELVSKEAVKMLESALRGNTPDGFVVTINRKTKSKDR